MNINSRIILSSATALLAISLAGSVSHAQSVTDKVSSAVRSTADKTTDWVKGAPEITSAAEVLSRIREVNETEIYAGKLAVRKGSTAEVRTYGKSLVKDHRAVNRKVEALAKDEGVQLSPPGPVSAELARLNNHDGAVREMLANVSGNTFDRDFLHAMVEDHQKNIDALKDVQAKSDDPKLKSFIQDLLPQLTDHQEMAEKLLEKAKKRASS
jgi:putative membrane protein